MIASLAGILLAVSATTQAEALEQLAGVLEGQAERISYLRIVARYFVEAPSAPADALKRIGEGRLTVVRTTQPLGLMYVLRDPDILHSAQGTFIEQVVEVAYDGRIGYYFRRKAGPEGQMVDLNSGWLVEDRPKELSTPTTYCGWTSTAHGLLDGSGTRLSDALREWARARNGKEHTAVTAKLGDEGYVVVLEAEKAYRELRFDRHGALTYRLERVGTIVTRETTVEGVELVGGVLPYPKLVVDAVYDTRGSLIERRKISVESVSIPSEPRFVIDFPAGASINDRIMGRSVQFGANVEEMVKMLPEEVRVLREARETERPLDEHSWSEWSSGRCALVGGASLTALLLILLVRRVLRSFASLAIVAGLACLAHAVPAQGDPVLGLVPAERVDNCGVNVCCVVGAFLGREVDPGAVAKALVVGSAWTGSASLGRIGRLLEEWGLAVTGLENADYAGLVGGLDGGTKIAILHQSAPEAHFFVAVRGKNGGLFVRDVGKRGLWIRPGVPAHEKFMATWSGFAVLVSERTQRVDEQSINSPTDLAKIDYLRVELGEIYQDSRQSTHSLSVANSSNQDIHIENIETSCSCIERVYFDNGDSVLRAGTQSKLWFTLAPGRLSSGYMQKKAAVHVRQNGESHVISLLVSGTVVKRLGRATAFVVPKKLDMGIRTSGTDVVDMVNVIAPDGVDVGEVKAEGGVTVEATDVSRYDLEFKGKVWSYLVTPPAGKGRVEGSVVFRFTAGEIEILKVPVAVVWR